MPFSRAMARAMMPRLVGFGWSSSKITSWLGSYGASYRNTTMLADIRKFRNLAEYSPRVIAASPTTAISKSLLSEVELTRPRKYRVYAEGKYTDLETGYTRYKNLSFYDDTRRSKEDWAYEFEIAKREAEYMPNTSITDVRILAVEHNTKLGY